MKKILLLAMLLAFSFSMYGQTFGWNLLINPGQFADTSNVMLGYPTGSGNLTGRFKAYSYQTLAGRLQPYLTNFGVPGIDAVLESDNLLTANRTIETDAYSFDILHSLNNSLILNTNGFTVGDINQNNSGNIIRVRDDFNHAFFDNIAHDGFFGINNNSPSSALDVVGNGIFSGNLSASNLSGTNTGDQDLTGYVEWPDTVSIIATKSNINSLRDSSWLKLTTNAIPENIDTAFRRGPTVVGGSSKIKAGDAVLQIDAIGKNSALDMHTTNGLSYAYRIYNSAFTEPMSYTTNYGAYYSRGWMVISGTDNGGSGYGFSLLHPSNESFMIGVLSDVGGPGFQVRASAAMGSYNISSMDNLGNTTWKLEADGTQRWGIDTLTMMDTDLFRDDSAKLFTSGSFGLGWKMPNPIKLAGYDTQNRFTDVFLNSDDFEFSYDTIYLAASAKNYAWLKSGAQITNTAADNLLDVYHEGDVHIGYSSMVGTKTLNVIGTMDLRQTLANNNIFINGGNTTATGTGNIALQDNAGVSITDGGLNTLLGVQSGQNITGGDRNIGLGYNSINGLISGNDNIGIGIDAVRSITTTSDNTGVGTRALYSTTGTGNVGIGLQAGYNNTGSDNVFIGWNAGNSSTGDKNVIVGEYAGNDFAGGGIALGYGAGYFSTEADKLYIHNTSGANEADGKLVSIIYGEMNPTTSSQLLHFNSKVLPRYMGGTATSMAGYDASGYLTTFAAGWGLDFVSGILKADTAELATQSDLPTPESIQDIVGAMFTGNTETNVTVDYQDADGTIDVVVTGGSPKYKTGITVDGGGEVITSGTKGRTQIETSGTITGVTVLADVSGSVTFDIKKCTFSGFPGSLTTIVGSNAPALSSAQKIEVTLDGGWTTSVTAGDVLEFSITGTPTTITQATLIIFIQP